MISPLTIYWIMQLDRIAFTSRLLAVLLLVGFIVTALCWADFASDADWYEGRHRDRALEGARRFRRLSLACAISAVFLFFTSAFIPSSKTAAAMVLIPAIANNETVQKEAGELYQLAKDGLKELVKPDEPKK